MIRYLSIFSLALFASSLKAQQAELDFFERRIRPVLVKHCYSCHSAKAKSLKGGLRVDFRQGLLDGGDSGPAVVPKKVGESLLIGALKHDTFKMPPKGKLPANIIKDFERWIARGAVMPKGSTKKVARRRIDLKAARSFWSFRPLRVSKPPRRADDRWSWGNIDRYVFDKIVATKPDLRPAGDVDRRTLIRRLFYDLAGLPPSPAEIQEFLNDQRPNAVSRVVDRLMTTPGFGERWGRHWLDVARYAESVGGGRTKIYQDAWRYRDYVLQALNKDKPYNQFLMEQIAGDLLPYTSAEQRSEQLVATGYLLLGPINYELQDKQLLRMEIIDEQLDTIGRSMLAMTIGCARCHDHKFDPIPTADYYALAGIFRSTHSVTPGNVSGFLKRPLPETRTKESARKAFARKEKQLKAKIAAIETQLGRGKGVIRRKNLAGIVLDDQEGDVHGSWLNSTSVRKWLDRGYVHDMGREKGQKWITYTPQIKTAGRYEIRVSYTAAANRSPNALYIISTAVGDKRIRVDQRKRPPIDGAFISLGSYKLRQGKRDSVTISNAGTTAIVIADAVQFIPASAQAKIVKSKPAAGNAKRRKLAKRLQQLRRQLRVLNRRKPAAAAVAMAVEDHQEAGDFFVCVRGDVHSLGKKVKRGFLSVLTPAKPKIAKKQSGRLQLGQWLARDNPLVARVIANRVWQHLMGSGIVRTPDNFGVMGERPSHPELLDHLAQELIRKQWSLKALIRQIVLSRSYQISANHNKSREVDPENRLFARRNRRRMDAECIRDAILAVSDRLSRQRGGPTVKPGTKSEFGYKFTSRRRGVYVPSFRNQLDDLLACFDIADPNLVTGRRMISTLPTQALFLLNSPFVHNHAELAAKRLLQQPASKTQRLKHAYALTLGREPSLVETRECLNFIEDEAKRGSSLIDTWSGIFRSLYSCVDFRYVE